MNNTKLLRQYQRRIKRIRKSRKKPKNYLDILAKQTRRKGYKYFLESKYWQIVRQRVLVRDNYKCRICGSNKDLRVHHDTYKNHYNEHRHLEDLITTCEKCHKDYHLNLEESRKKMVSVKCIVN